MVFLIIALWRLVRVMQFRIASKIAVNKTAIAIHLICFTIYVLIQALDVFEVVKGENWIFRNSSHKVRGETILFISTLIAAFCSQLLILIIFVLISKAALNCALRVAEEI